MAKKNSDKALSRVDDSQYGAPSAELLATAASNEPVPCSACGGEGQMVIGEHYVTRDMASDACEPAMEGMFHSYAYGECDECGGTGISNYDAVDPVGGDSIS